MTFQSALTCVIGCVISLHCGAAEFRAIWADTFHAGMRSADEVTAMVEAVRAANCNALVVEVRKRGDAYYRHGLEPVASGVANGFDPLADLLQKAHDTTGGKQRVEVHAWLVTYNIWNHQTSLPPQPDHPFRRHPDWLSSRYEPDPGTPAVTWAGTSPGSGNYFFDPGHPAVQQHTFDVVMDLLTRYDLDGVNFDYIRYPDSVYWGGESSQPWGYHPVAVARFNSLHNRTGTPPPNDAQWLQWRRDQVTALLRKIYLHAFAIKPGVRISVDVIAYDPVPSGTTAGAWRSTSAYRSVLQDWRGWLQEGIVDLACPMVYRPQNTSGTSFASWAGWISRQQFSRASAVGLGWYLNAGEETIRQIRTAREAGTDTARAAGVLGYSYAVFDNSGVNGAGARNSFSAALTSGPEAPFAAPVATPPMFWKSDPTTGHLMGTVSTGGVPVDGATVTLTGPETRSLLTDGTGFFGAVDLVPGSYVLTYHYPEGGVTLQTVAVSGAQVTSVVLHPESPAGPLPFRINSVARNDATGALTIGWNAQPGATYRVERAAGLHTWAAVATGLPFPGETGSLTWSPPAITGSRMFVRVVQEQ